MSKQEKINEILEYAKDMVLAGTLLKNVKRHFVNLGCSEELAEKICKIAKYEAEQWMLNKAI